MDSSNDKIQRLKDKRDILIEELKSLNSEIEYLNSFYEDSRNLEGINSVWDKIESNDEINVDQMKLNKMNLELNGLKILKYKKSLHHYDNLMVQTEDQIEASCYNHSFKIFFTVNQMKDKLHSKDSVTISSLDIIFENEIDKNLVTFIDKIKEHNDIQCFMKNFPIYCKAYKDRNDAFDSSVDQYDDFISICKNEWVLKLQKNIRCPKLLIHWNIVFNSYLCVEVDIKITVEPKGWSQIYDEIPLKFPVMRKIMGDKEAFKSIVEALCTTG